MKPITILCFSLLCNSLLCQVTTTNIEARRGIIVAEKPEPYDSTKSWENFESLVQYKRYIGQRLYLPPRLSNPEFLLFNPEFTLIESDSLTKLGNELITGVYEPSHIHVSQHAKYEITSISTNLYKPKLDKVYINPYDHSYYFHLFNDESIGDRYYQIIDVIPIDSLSRLVNQIPHKKTISNDEFHPYAVFDFRIKYKENVPFQKDILVREESEILNFNTREQKHAFVLVDEISNDTLLSYNYREFILVSNFVKLRSVYKDQNLIYYYNARTYPNRDTNLSVSHYSDMDVYRYVNEDNQDIKMPVNGSWFCKDVTVSSNTNEIVYVLENENNDIILLENLDDFTLEKQIQKDRAAKEKAHSEQEEIWKRKEQQAQENLRLKKDKRRKECVDKYGQQNCTIILANKVKTGMSMEMCEMAWGIPYLRKSTSNESRENEIWFYGSKELHFENGMLIKSVEVY